MRLHWRAMIPGAMGVALVASLATMAACSDKGTGTTVPNGSPTPARSTGGTVDGPEPILKVPASKYTPGRTELPGIYSVNVPETFTQNISTFASSYLFRNNEEGGNYARQWRIIDGYKVAYDPDGLGAGVLKGNYYITVETYLFEGTAGANDAFDYMDKLFGGTAGTEKPDVKRLANRSAGYKLISGTVGASEVPQAYYRFLFRRGNAVSVVQVAGADSFVSIDQAREVAVIIDQRMLGDRPATEPTPIPTPKINLPPQPTATPVGGG